MTDTEDPNIATLREALQDCGHEYPVTAVRALRSLQALASALTERDRRIAALESGLRAVIEERYEYASGEGAFRQAIARATLEGTRLDGLPTKAPPAPAPGELARLHCRECNYHPSEPINCAQCGASYCMTREPMPALNGGDDNG